MKQYKREQTVNTYSFDELNERAKANIRNTFADHCIEPEDFKFDVIHFLTEDWGISTLEPSFSLSHKQGDGLCLHGYISIDDILENENMCMAIIPGVSVDKTFLRQIVKGFDLKKTGRYSHASSVDIEILFNDYDVNEHEFSIEVWSDTLTIIEENFIRWYWERCTYFVRMGYEFFYEYEDKVVKEWIDEAGYLLNINGQIIGTIDSNENIEWNI